jgi:hypothetical protein
MSTLDVSEYNQNQLNIYDPLSVLPNGSRTLQTLPRNLSDKWSSGDLEMHNEPCAFYEDLLSLNYKHRCSFPFVSMILAKSEIWSSVSLYLVQSRYRPLLLNSFHDIPSPWPSHMLCSFGSNITKWAQSIFPSCGRTNPALGTDASTYSIGKPKDTFSMTHFGNDSWCNQTFCPK